MMRSMFLLRISALIVALIIIAAIGSLSGQSNDSTYPFQPTERAFQPIATATSASEPISDCTPLLGVSKVRHHAAADVNLSNHIVKVRQQIQFVNRTIETLNEIILNIEANRWNDVFSVSALTIAGEMREYTLDGKRLSIQLPEGLAPECEITLNLEFQLNVPLIGDGIFASKGYFGYTNRQFNLGHWLATVAILDGDSWTSRTPFLIGEQEALEKADWDVTINLSPDANGYIIAAPGLTTQIAPGSWRFLHLNARDFSLSISNQFDVTTQATETGVEVELYTLDDSPVQATAQALNVAVQSLEMYGDLFSEYPHDRLVIVQGDFPDGMELSGIIYVGGAWFVNYPDGPASYLTLITAHETAHQWWYGQVGNDPAITPWLDEALATYSEYIYIEEYYPELKDWWWNFRVNQYSPQGYVDSTVYDFGSNREYINAVYLRGALMLDSLRTDLGTDAFFELLADYAAAGNGRIASPDLFWSLLTPAQLALTQNTRNRFLQYPQILATAGQ